jgi:hypothetical protein
VIAAFAEFNATLQLENESRGDQNAFTVSGATIFIQEVPR